MVGLPVRKTKNLAWNKMDEWPSSLCIKISWCQDLKRSHHSAWCCLLSIGKYPDKISNARGLGLMCAFDCKSPEKRDELLKKIYANDLIVIGCGEKTVRFRPPLIISDDEVDRALFIIDNTLKTF